MRLPAKTCSIIFVIFHFNVFGQNIPEDFNNYVLLIETYNNDDFIELRTNKYFNPLTAKNPHERYEYSIEYHKKVISKCPIAYIAIEKDSISTFNQNDFPYVLRLGSRIVKESKYVDENGIPVGWKAEIYAYIIDRRQNKAYNDILAKYGKKMWKDLNGK